MELIKKVFEDNNLTLEDMHGFIISLEEFLKKFNEELDMDELRIHLEISKKALGVFGRSQREYLDSVLDFIDCLSEDLKIKELQEHLRSALEYLKDKEIA